MHRKIIATLFRGKKKEKVWTRYYSWMDTAMPRAVQLALQTGVEGDVIEFASVDLGFQIGILRLMPNNRTELEVSPLVKHSPSLMKLMNPNMVG